MGLRHSLKFCSIAVLYFTSLQTGTKSWRNYTLHSLHSFFKTALKCFHGFSMTGLKVIVIFFKYSFIVGKVSQIHYNIFWLPNLFRVEVFFYFFRLKINMRICDYFMIYVNTAYCGKGKIAVKISVHGCNSSGSLPLVSKQSCKKNLKIHSKISRTLFFFYSLYTIVRITIASPLQGLYHLNHISNSRKCSFSELFHSIGAPDPTLVLLWLSAFTILLQEVRWTPAQVCEGQGTFTPICHFPAEVAVSLSLVRICPALFCQPIAEEKQIWSPSAAPLQLDSPWLWPSHTSRLFRVVRSPAVKCKMADDRNTSYFLFTAAALLHWCLCAHL